MKLPPLCHSVSALIVCVCVSVCICVSVHEYVDGFLYVCVSYVCVHCTVLGWSVCVCKVMLQEWRSSCVCVCGVVMWKCPVISIHRWQQSKGALGSEYSHLDTHTLRVHHHTHTHIFIHTLTYTCACTPPNTHTLVLTLTHKLNTHTHLISPHTDRVYSVHTRNNCVIEKRRRCKDMESSWSMPAHTGHQEGQRCLVQHHWAPGTVSP